MEILEQTKTTEIQSIANDINKGIEAFEKRKSELLEMASHADGLKIESIDDREGIKEVSRLRKDLKFARVEIQKEGKAMRDPLTGISKFIIEKEKELVAIIEPVEHELKEQEDWVAAEKQRIADEARRKEEERINKRINALAELGFAIEYSELKVMTDEEFDELLLEAKEQHEKELEAKRLEEQRQEMIQKRKQMLFEIGMNYSMTTEAFTCAHDPRETITEEAIGKLDDKEFDVLFQSAKQSLDAEKARIEADRKRMEEQQAELDRMRKEAEQREAKIRAEQERIEAEKRALEAAANEQKHKEELEMARKEAAEQARKQAIADAKRKEEERLKRERKAQERAAKKEAMRPDKEKIEAYLESILKVPESELKNDESKAVMRMIGIRILDVVDWAMDELNRL